MRNNERTTDFFDFRATSDERRATDFRVGIGYDIHRLVHGRPLILGGVQVPFEMGLLGHSDGDCLLHAIADAMLGALALGDIGRHFPDTDPTYKGADSLSLLKHIACLIGKNGWRLVNCDANIIAEKPKLTQYIEAMCLKIAPVLGIAVDCIGIKARTNEGLDAVGRGEAIATHAVVLVTKDCS